MRTVLDASFARIGHLVRSYVSRPGAVVATLSDLRSCLEGTIAIHNLVMRRAFFTSEFEGLVPIKGIKKALDFKYQDGDTLTWKALSVSQFPVLGMKKFSSSSRNSTSSSPPPPLTTASLPSSPGARVNSSIRVKQGTILNLGHSVQQYY